MRASQHVIRRPAAVDDAVPEAVVETRASVTTRIDLTQLSPLMADCVEPEGDQIEIQLEAAELRASGSQQLHKVGRNGLAHTTRRAGTSPIAAKPARELKLPLPPPPAMSAAAPIREAPVTHTSKTAPIARVEDAPRYSTNIAAVAPMDTARPIDEIAEAHAVEVLMGEMTSRPRVKLGYVLAAVAGVAAAVATIACM
jgi:hypothetical protein